MNSPAMRVMLRIAAALVVLVLGPTVRLSNGLAGSDREGTWIALVAAVLAYLGAHWSLSRSKADPASMRPALRTVLLHFGAWFGLLLLLIICLQSDLFGRYLTVFGPRRVLMLLAWSLTALLISLWWRVSSRLATTILVVAAVIVTVAHLWLSPPPGPIVTAAVSAPAVPAPAAPQTESFVDTSLYQLKLTEYAEAIPRGAQWRPGGGIAQFGESPLLVTGDGSMYVLNLASGTGTHEFRRLPYQAPLNYQAFEAGASQLFADLPDKHVEVGRFRVTGVLAQEIGTRLRLLVAHHYWHSDEACFTMRISALEGAREKFDVADALTWRTVYETRPCLSLNTTGPGVRFEGNESGGKMVAQDADTILFSVGDHAFDGVLRTAALAQDPNADYGKILRIRLPDGKATVYTMGHRNPQGLHITADGEIWSTEHGPRGGDELNRIVKGRNYGWPLATYGTAYSRRIWPSNAHQGRHEGFERPVFAFVPSVGLSPLTSVNSDRFALWKGDLLAGTLRSEELIRFRIWDGRVVLAVHIPIGRRIRDVFFDRDGRLLLWTDKDSLVEVEPTDATEGEALASICTGCHDLSWPDNPSSALGPNLSGFTSRPVASRTDFDYSDALKRLGGYWTPERLSRFLEDPQNFAPGTRMEFGGIADEGQRQALVELLTNTAQNE